MRPARTRPRPRPARPKSPEAARGSWLDSDGAPDVTISYSDDADAAWLRKGNRAYYGYKIHATTDWSPKKTNETCRTN